MVIAELSQSALNTAAPQECVLAGHQEQAWQHLVSCRGRPADGACRNVHDDLHLGWPPCSSVQHICVV